MQHHLNMSLKYVTLLYHSLEQKHTIDRKSAVHANLESGLSPQKGRNNNSRNTRKQVVADEELALENHHGDGTPKKEQPPSLGEEQPPSLGEELTGDALYLTAVMLNSSLLKAMHVVESFQNHASEHVESRDLTIDDYVSFDGTLTTIYEGENPQTAKPATSGGSSASSGLNQKNKQDLQQGTTCSSTISSSPTSSYSASSTSCYGPHDTTTGGIASSTTSETNDENRNASEKHDGDHPGRGQSSQEAQPQEHHLPFREQVRKSASLHEVITALTEQQQSWKEEIMQLREQRSALEKKLVDTVVGGNGGGGG
eukprot:GSA25T00026121001.1